jgi:DNA modification methylase
MISTNPLSRLSPRYVQHVPGQDYDLQHNWVVRGDCRSVLADLPDRCADLIFADPPYFLQLQNELRRPNNTVVDAVDDEWDQFTDWAEYDAFTREWLRECQRVLKNTGTLWVIGMYHNIYRLGTIMQDLGFWMLNSVIWEKCLAESTRVYARTERGERPMALRDLVRADSNAELWNGERWTRVTAWRETECLDGLEVELRSGEKIRCTPTHQWPTQRGLVTAGELRVGDVLVTARLPEPASAVKPQGLDDQSVGWFVGLYLAEGTRYEGTISIAGHVREIDRYHRLCKLAEAYHGQCRTHNVHGDACQIHLHGPVLNAILDLYISGNTAKGKYLSPRCWQRSNAFLRAVLEGYLSGDGHYEANTGRYQLGFTQNRELEHNLRTLCARLGIHLRLRDGRSRLGDREFPTIRGEIRLTKSGHWNEKPDGEVVKISSANATRYIDLAVEDDPHTFCLASGVVSHNCNPVPQFRGVRFCNAHEELIWATKGAKYARGYTFNYHELKQENGGKQMRSVWRFPICSGDARKKGGDGKKLHSTEKPLPLLERIVAACTGPGDLVLDPFAGTGTTGEAALRLDRRYFLVEQQALYIDAGIRPRLTYAEIELAAQAEARRPARAFRRSGVQALGSSPPQEALRVER